MNGKEKRTADTDAPEEPAGQTLRQRAEAISGKYAAYSPEGFEAMSPEATRRMLHEVQVQQIELEMQNEELRRTQAELEDTRARYIDLYDMAPVGYCTVSERGLILQANLTAATLLGVGRRALLKQRFTQFILPDDQGAYMLFRKKLIALGNPQACRLRMVKPDGAQFWGHLAATATHDEDGAPTFRIVLSDTTESTKAEEALCESEADLRAILDNSPYMIWLKDANGRYLKVNKSYAEYRQRQGYVEILGKTDFDLWPKELAEKYRADDADVIATRQQRQVEEPSLDGDRVHWVETFKAPIIDAQGNVLGTTGFTRDITERKQAELVLHQQQYFIRQIIDSDPNMISVKDAEGRFLLVNQAMAAMHGVSPEELVGKSGAEQFQSKENFDPILQADLEVIKTLRRVELVTRDFRNGQERWFHIIKVPMRQPDGTVQVLGIGVDITEKRIADQQLRELTAHLQTVREEEKVSIAREIHDDLGSTLTALKMEIYWLAREVTEDKEPAPLLERIEAITQLLDSAVVVTRRVISELHPTILDDLGLLAALEWQAGRFQKRTGIECQVACTQDEGCETELSKAQAINLFRIFQETLTNVTRHSGASRVDVKFRLGDQIILSIRDNGRGLPEGHTIASTSYGMRSMTERVKYLGGKIKFDSPPGGGLGVTVTLPANHQQGSAA